MLASNPASFVQEINFLKSESDDQNRFKRINVKKVASLTDLTNKPIEQVTFDIKSLDQLNEISKILDKNGDTLINIIIHDDKNDLSFQLKNKRNLDRKTLNLLRNKEISAIIN